MSSQAFDQLLTHIQSLSFDTYQQSFEQLRDEIHELGTDVLPAVLEQAQHPQPDHTQDLWVMVLADSLYPPALPFLVSCLTHARFALFNKDPTANIESFHSSIHGFSTLEVFHVSVILLP